MISTTMWLGISIAGTDVNDLYNHTSSKSKATSTSPKLKKAKSFSKISKPTHIQFEPN